MKNFRKIVVVLALAFSGLTGAEIVTLVESVETVTANVKVPTSTNSRLMFKPCADDCKENFVSVRLTPETIFVINGQRMIFADFRKNFFNLPRGNDTYALISYDTSTKVVVSVSIGI